MNIHECGTMIRATRKAAGLTQEEVAKAVGIGRATLSRIETGLIDEIGLRKYMRLCEHLELVVEVRPKPPPPTLEVAYAQADRDLVPAAELTDQMIGVATNHPQKANSSPGKGRRRGL